MAKATASDKELLSCLVDLATQARNSEKGYRHSAEDARDSDLRAMFADLARERSNQADEVDGIIRRLGGEPPSREGSTAGTIHRMFVDLKTTLSGNNRRAVLVEVARGEGYAEETYDKALRLGMPEDIRQTIQRQHSSVRASRDRFRTMAEAAGGSLEGGMAGSIRSGVEDYVVERPMMGTALAFGIGIVAGVLLAMSMRMGAGSGGGDRTSYGGGHRTGYGHGDEGRRAAYGDSTSRYGGATQTRYGAETERRYGQDVEAGRANS